jgi:hypothetical protein
VPKGQRNAEKTHCSNDHPYDEANTYRYLRASDGIERRQCIICRSARSKAQHAARIKKTPRRKTWTIEDRFWSYVDKNGPVSEHRPDLGPCWIWTGSKTLGYGVSHCPQGHPYDDENTYRTAKGHRQCIACRKARNAHRRAA